MTPYAFARPVAALMLLGALANGSDARAEEPAVSEKTIDPQRVIAYQGTVELTQVELDAAFSKIPQANRLVFIRDGAKVDQLIRTLLKRKIIAAEAASAGFDADPVVAARVDLEAKKELAEAWMQNVVQNAPAADYEALAYEDYLANPDSYRTEVVLDVSHILLGVEDRTVDEARELAQSLSAELVEDPSKFDRFVEQYSDDPGKGDNAGRYTDMRRGMMVEPFEIAAYALKAIGAISEPVESEFGYHLIRLNGRSGGDLPKYEAIKEAAVARAEARYLESYRQRYLRKILSGTVVIPAESVEVMARRHFGENLERAPDFNR